MEKGYVISVENCYKILPKDSNSSKLGVVCKCTKLFFENVKKWIKININIVGNKGVRNKRECT